MPWQVRLSRLRVLAVIGTIIVALVAGGCGAGGKRTATFDPADVSSGVSSSTTLSRTTVHAKTKRPKTKAAAPGTFFQSPSGNIHCNAAPISKTVGLLACETLNNNVAVVIGGDGSSVLRMHGSSRLRQRGRVIAYGHSITLDGFRCDSESDGMACTSTETGNGFLINREGQNLLGAAEWFDANADTTPTAPQFTVPAPAPPPSTVPQGDFCSSHPCIPSFPNGTGSIVQCADGAWSHSGGRQGACSGHGGEL